MTRALSIFLLCCALAQISGLNLAILQVQAWAEMIYERSEQGVAQAVYSTLSGEAPCEKCIHVREQRKEQDKNTFSLSSLDKLKLPLSSDKKFARKVQIEAHLPNFPPYLMLPSQVYLGIERPPPQV